ncbi:MAG: hypothetical protein Q8N81_07695 [bacterium]|nr:hypothetical protein [bacterium]
MSKKLLITFVVLALIAAGFIGSALVARNKFINPQSLSYNLKLAGEWLDVNFITFEASAKQAKHLEFSQRRLDEFLAYGSAISPSQAKQINRSYEMELARAEYMAEQLILLDHKFIPLLEAVYRATLEDIKKLWPNRIDPGDGGFLISAEIYNTKSIKRLLQKHQYGKENTESYRGLVEMRVEWSELLPVPSSGQKETLVKARQVFKQGKELEWAYDLAASLR